MKITGIRKDGNYNADSEPKKKKVLWGNLIESIFQKHSDKIKMENGIFVRIYDRSSQETDKEFIHDTELLEMIEKGESNYKIALHIGCTNSEKLNIHLNKLRS